MMEPRFPREVIVTPLECRPFRSCEAAQTPQFATGVCQRARLTKDQLEEMVVLVQAIKTRIHGVTLLSPTVSIAIEVK